MAIVKVPVNISLQFPMQSFLI